MGDSLMAHLAPKVERRMPGWEISSESRPGTGLVADGKIRYDWLRRLRELVAERDPDVVVGWWMGVYWHADGREASAEELRPRWTAAVEEAQRILTARGAIVHWVLTPHMLLPNWDRIAMMVNDVYRGVAARNGRTTTVIDAKSPLDGPGDTYAQYLRDDQGRMEQVRDDDGVHLTDAGVERFWGNAAAALGRYDAATFRLR